MSIIKKEIVAKAIEELKNERISLEKITHIIL